MSKHNYSQYSNKKKNSDGKSGAAATNAEYRKSGAAATNTEYRAVASNVVPSKTEPTQNFEPVATPAPKVKMEVELVQETVETVALPATVEGIITNCSKLNVRAEPDIDARVVCVLDVMSEIKIDVAKSTKEWFKVYTAIGVEGYCMRKFVDARL